MYSGFETAVANLAGKRIDVCNFTYMYCNFTIESGMVILLLGIMVVHRWRCNETAIRKMTSGFDSAGCEISSRSLN